MLELVWGGDTFFLKDSLPGWMASKKLCSVIFHSGSEGNLHISSRVVLALKFTLLKLSQVRAGSAMAGALC